jgi:hypothetical protein
VCIVALLLMLGAACGSSGGQSGGSLSSGFAPATAPVRLSDEGALDWAQWGYLATDAASPNTFVGNTVPNDCRYDLHCYNHKRGSGSRISDFFAIGHVTPFRLYYRDEPRRFSWTDGVPIAAVTGARALVYMGLVGNGFRITVPADTTERTLRLYVAIYQGTAACVAALSDGSAAVFRDETLRTTWHDVSTEVVYTFRYRAAGEGRRLTVLFLLQADAGGGNVSLQAATLR